MAIISWSETPAWFIASLTSHLHLSRSSIAAIRRVNKHWRDIHDSLLTTLVPRRMPTDPSKVPLWCSNVRVVDLSRWVSKVCDSDLRWAASSFSQAQVLVVCGEKRWWGSDVSDAGLLAVSQHMKSLTSLDLRFCRKVSDAGVRSLRGLPNLQQLWLRDGSMMSSDGIWEAVRETAMSTAIMAPS
mmetsp:Transcript_19395/g.37148  ORF Transcript_19395/g.37148 Transcript_19395/m.37148 type:complete len:185 (-) Transcript_19395:487-1041(-)